MAIYLDIRGTTHDSFKIGTRGISISTQQYVDEESKEIIQNLLANGKIVLSEDNLNLILPREICTSIESVEDSISAYIFKLKYFDTKERTMVTKRLTLSKTQIDKEELLKDTVKGPDGPVTDNNIVLFDGTDGRKIKDSGLSIKKEISEEELEPVEEDKNTIPTTSAVKDLLGITSQPLKNRINGIIK